VIVEIRKIIRKKEFREETDMYNESDKNEEDDNEANRDWDFKEEDENYLIVDACKMMKTATRADTLHLLPLFL
jgi:hypothetical protein